RMRKARHRDGFFHADQYYGRIYGASVLRRPRQRAGGGGLSSGGGRDQLPASGCSVQKETVDTGLYGGSAAALGRRRINGKTAVETRKYAVSAACGAGDCRRQPGTGKCIYCSLGGYSLHQSSDGVYFRTPGTVFLRNDL